MASKKKGNHQEPKNEGAALGVPHQNVIVQSITDEMRTSYLDYSMSVITQRALPDVRDGLKPVHRRISIQCVSMVLRRERVSKNLQP